MRFYYNIAKIAISSQYHSFFVIKKSKNGEMLFEVAFFINLHGYFLRRDSDCRSSSLLQMYD